MTLADKDRRYLWHPFTQMHDYAERDILVVDRAEGLLLYDDRGRAYYDTISSWWCIVHGHNHPVITERVRAQMGRLDHVLFAGIGHEAAILLAERLVALTPPGLSRVFFSDNGSTACEVAVKMSLQYWQLVGQGRRQRFVGVERGYHGDTIGTMSLGGVPGYHGAFAPLLFDSHRIPSPYCYRCPLGRDRKDCGVACAEALEQLLAREGESVAAVILEPLIQAAGGMIVYPVEYLTRVCAIARHYGVHLILDEVATGFGRTGRMFALEHAGVEPDFLCLSKGLTGGVLPMAATLTSEEIFQAFYGEYRLNRTFYHGHTFTGNPLAAAAALASLDVFAAEGTLEKATAAAAHLAAGMERFRALPWVGDIRCLGMIAAMELVRDRETREPFAFEDRVGWPVYLAGLERGLILRPLGNVVYLWLPLSVTTDEIDDILDRTWQVLHQRGVLPPR
ncbi:MAG: adenosylmethionine--8-amino-7-oxononanoate transaminase [Thermodesulfobacteriota bacterium]